MLVWKALVLGGTLSSASVSSSVSVAVSPSVAAGVERQELSWASDTLSSTTQSFALDSLFFIRETGGMIGVRLAMRFLWP
jgi:hypothetical protein